VALAMWRRWQLPELLADLLPANQAHAGMPDAVAVLVLHRCIEPGSKLSAQRWFPKTALPELLGVAPPKLNNTHIHRTLTALERIDDALQERLPRRLNAREGLFVSLFLDVTDTWFVGRGPPDAERGKTKEGMVRRKIGIVLLCNERGYPLRWQVVPGKRQDGQAMTDMVSALQQVSWAGTAPLVCDRAMGKGCYVEMLADSGLCFLTAVPTDEFASYSSQIPYEALSNITITGREDTRQEDLARVVVAISEAGMDKVSDDDLYALDLGVIEKNEPRGPARPARSAMVASQLLQLGRQMKAELESGVATSFSDLGRRHDCSKARAVKLVHLLDLAADIQESIDTGLAESLSLATLQAIRRLPTPQEQREAFEAALEAANRKSHGRGQPAKGGWHNKPDSEPSIAVRVVVYFSPSMFIEQRQHADEVLGAIYAFVRELNNRLASGRSRRTQASILGDVAAQLRRRSLFDAFDVHLAQHQDNDRQWYQVKLTLRQAAWQRRRCHDGFFLLVGHCDLPHTAAELAVLYRAKDAVEKDFQTIKSELELRPIRHRTNPKVRAHVTLCMLALLLERTLEHRLRDAGIPRTAGMALQELAACHLNELRVAAEPIYTVTEPSAEAARLLGALGLDSLVDDEEVAQALVAR
jgi:hypothetical protein